MEAGSKEYTRELPDDDDVPEVFVPSPSIDDRMARTAEKLEADVCKVDTMIRRFPRAVRGIGGDNDRYIVPSVVAIGPYHHRAPHLHEMEEVKFAAAYYICRASDRYGTEVYEKVCSVAAAARGCYDADDPAVMGLSDTEFATMMFLDGCFLLQYMVAVGSIDVSSIDNDTPAAFVLQNRMTGPSIQKDIFLLENQIPWLVLEVLLEFMPVKVRRFVAGLGQKLELPPENKGWNCPCCRWRMHCGCIPTVFPKTRPSDEERRGGIGKLPPPPHLLGLLRFNQVGRMPEVETEYMMSFSTLPSSWSSSAVELAQMGVQLKPSTEPWFGDMRLRKGLLCGELTLSPVFVSDVTACWLVNMVALEASTAVVDRATDGFQVSSYLSVLAMLMDREEDVQQLRAKHLVYSTFSDKQALGFFKGLSQHLRFGRRYFAVLEQIDSYKRHRSARIYIHRLLYNSFKAMTIATLFSIVGVLVGIFKTLLDNKKK